MSSGMQQAVPTIESVRSKLEAIESHKQAIVRQLLVNATHPAHQIAKDHFIKQQLDLIAEAADDACDVFEEPEELIAVCEKPAEGSSVNAARVVSEFEASLAKLREYHHHHPQPDWKPTIDTLTAEDAERNLPFTEAERLGKCLDLKVHYENYIEFFTTSTQKMEAKNLKPDSCRVLSYVDFVKQLHTVFKDPKSIGQPRKLSALDIYTRTLTELLNYLVKFQNNMKPLEESSIQAALKDVETQFKSRWSQYGSREWLQGVSKDDAPKVQATALLEAKVDRMMTVLGSVIAKTATFTTLKQTRTTEELLQDQERDITEFIDAFKMDSAAAALSHSAHQQSNASSSGPTAGSSGTMRATDYNAASTAHSDLYTEAEQAKFGVKEVPLDVDGNPIPRWMANLHQLNKKFTCEICGNEVYCGPKVFEEHFREERHLEGLQRLGIPDYHPCVYLATDPQEAINRWIRYSKEKTKMHMREGDEEMEDGQGTVFTKADLHEFHKNIVRR